MTRSARWMVVAVALAALCGAVVHGTPARTRQNPPATTAAKPDTQAKDGQAKPADAKAAEAKAPEPTPEQKAFNAIAEEKDAQKRIPLYEKFIQDNPNASLLVSLARSEILRASLVALKSSTAKYLEMAKKEIDSAKASPAQLPSTYARYATDLLNAGALLDDAEEFARQSVALLDEQKYIADQKATDQRMVDAAAKRAADPNPLPPEGFSMRTVNGAPVVLPPSRPAPSRPATPRNARTEEELRTSFRQMRAANLATLGRVLMKRNKTAEAEKILKEAWDLNPPSATRATIAKVLAESAKKAGNEAAQFEYLTVVALGGRITVDEQNDFEAIYRKTHNGSLDGLDAMLDARYARENPRFPVPPANRATVPNQRAVLAENFTGSG